MHIMYAIWQCTVCMHVMYVYNACNAYNVTIIIVMETIIIADTYLENIEIYDKYNVPSNYRF